MPSTWPWDQSWWLGLWHCHTVVYTAPWPCQSEGVCFSSPLPKSAKETKYEQNKSNAPISFFFLHAYCWLIQLDWVLSVTHSLLSLIAIRGQHILSDMGFMLDTLNDATKPWGMKRRDRKKEWQEMIFKHTAAFQPTLAITSKYKIFFFQVHSLHKGPPGLLFIPNETRQ